ncbi:hypothetical protein JOD45_003086 [Scopulibacillus daqui]|uniref:Uncharacterized protein n=1 Tax=Scopulibacillus daqui TaxID=1469162 RepID=A0ABS2Q5S9_9BACL|nr:hypothetical protein [Scopulibacillus daqui]MBM7646852.1 hypothetical protein [Scopulibacillus daqui]
MKQNLKDEKPLETEEKIGNIFEEEVDFPTYVYLNTPIIHVNDQSKDE